MPEMEAIQAATVNAADLLRISDKLGSVEVGKLADLVAVEGNPLENIELMIDVQFVMKDGVVYKNEFALLGNRGTVYLRNRGTVYLTLT